MIVYTSAYAKYLLEDERMVKEQMSVTPLHQTAEHLIVRNFR